MSREKKYDALERKEGYRKNESFLSDIGKRIRYLRKHKGISQEELFFLTGIAADKICKIENGKINTGVSNILFIAEALDVSIKEILDFEQNKNENYENN